MYMEGRLNIIKMKSSPQLELKSQDKFQMQMRRSNLVDIHKLIVESHEGKRYRKAKTTKVEE